MFIIKKVTKSLEQAMILNHGITYADYQSNLEKSIRVEINREGNHRKAVEIVKAFLSSHKRG